MYANYYISDIIVPFVRIIPYFCKKIYIMFSKACEYSIRAAIFIAARSMEGKRSNLKIISTSIDSPEAFTAKMLQQLVRHKVIDSVQGVQGGFEIKKNRIRQIKLYDIVEAIDGDDVFKMCALGLKVCSSKNPCPIHHQFKVIRKSLKDMLNDVSLYQLSQGVIQGKTLLTLKDLNI